MQAKKKSQLSLGRKLSAFLFSAVVVLFFSCKEEKKGMEIENVGKTELIKKSAPKKEDARSEDSSRKNKTTSQKGNEENLDGILKFEMQNTETENNIPQVEHNTANIKIEIDSEDKTGDSEKQAALAPPPESLAGILGKDGKSYSWTPNLSFGATISARLPSICSSTDESLIAICETSGKESGPNGSMIILIDTFSWKILRIFCFKDEKISKIVFFPSSLLLGIATEKQELIEKSARFFVFDLKRGTESAGVAGVKGRISDIAAWNKSLLVKISEASNEILSLSADGKNCLGTCETDQNTDGVFAIFDSETAAFAGNKSIVFFDDALRIHKKIKCELLPQYLPEKAKFLWTKDRIAISSYSKPAYLFKGEATTEICARSGKILELENDNLTIEHYLDSKIVFLGKDLKESCPPLIISKIKPISRGRPIFLKFLKHHAKYLVVDNFGDFGLYELAGKRKWRKTPVRF